MIQTALFTHLVDYNLYTSQFNEEDAAEDHSKSPAKANVDDIQGFGSTDLVISSPKVTVWKYSHVGCSQLPFPSFS